MEEILIEDNDIFKMIIKFNGKEIPLYHFINSYKNKKDDSKDMLEILPSIYCNTILNTLDGVDRLYYQLQSFWLGRKEQYIIYVKNMRDYFSVIGKDYKVEYPKTTKIDVRNTYIDTKLLPYPSMLGGGCWMWRLFEKIDLLQSSTHSLYCPLTEAQVLKVTENCKVLNEKICRQSRCERFIKKMMEGTFVPIYEDEDFENAISMECIDGKFRLYEGKHRVCAAKRFKLKQIPATIYYYTITNDKKLQDEHEHTEKMWIQNGRYIDLCDEILKECYRIYTAIGLSEDNIRELNEAVDDDNYIAFLERKTGKCILEILGVD